MGIVELEMHSYYLQQRIRDLTQHMPPEVAHEALANIEFLVRPNFTGLIDLMEQSTRDGIINWVNNRGLGVLAMDALSRCHFASENDAQEMGRVLGSIERIRDETGAGIWGVHHEPKDVKDKDVSDLDAARGSSRFQSDPHTMMRLKVWRGKRVVCFAKMTLGPLLQPIYIERNEHGHYQVQDIFRDSDITRVFEELSRAFGFSSPEDIFSRTNFYGDQFRTFQFKGPGCAGRGFFFFGPMSKTYQDMMQAYRHQTKEVPTYRPSLVSKILLKDCRHFRNML